MKAIYSMFVAGALMGCPSTPTSSSAAAAYGTGSGGGATVDGGQAGTGGTGGTGGTPDAGCYMNGGFACATNADCPPSNGCGFCFSCDALVDGTKACRWHPLDAGFCDPF